MIPDYKCKKQDEDADYNEDYSSSQSSYESSYYDYGQPESWSSSGQSYQKTPNLFYFESYYKLNINFIFKLLK